MKERWITTSGERYMFWYARLLIVCLSAHTGAGNAADFCVDGGRNCLPNATVAMTWTNESVSYDTGTFDKEEFLPVTGGRGKSVNGKVPHILNQTKDEEMDGSGEDPTDFLSHFSTENSTVVANNATNQPEGKVLHLSATTSTTSTPAGVFAWTLPDVAELYSDAWTLPSISIKTPATTAPTETSTLSSTVPSVTKEAETAQPIEHDTDLDHKDHEIVHIDQLSGLSTSYCSEFVKLPAQSDGHWLRKRPNKYSESEEKDVWVLLECSGETRSEGTRTDYGFHARHVECDPDKSIFVQRDSDSKSFASTSGKVKSLKSFVVHRHAYVIAILADRRSHLYEIRSGIHSDSPLHVVKIQDIPHRYISDVDVVTMSAGNTFVAFSIFHPHTHDKSKTAEKISPIYRFVNGRLLLCDYVPVTGAVAVRGWEDHHGLLSLVFASEPSTKSKASILSFFEVLSDDERLCRVLPRSNGNIISSVGQLPLCGVQSLELMLSDQRRYLIVGSGRHLRCNCNGTYGRSFILPENYDFRSEKVAFETQNAAEIPSKENHDKFRVVEQECGTILVGYGQTTETELFTVADTLHGLMIQKLDSFNNVKRSAGMALGVCGSQPFLNLDGIDPPDLDETSVSLTMRCKKIPRGGWGVE